MPDSNNNDTRSEHEPPPYSGPIPPYMLHSSMKPKRRRMGCIGCIVLILAVAALINSYLKNNPPKDIYSLLPLDTVFVVETTSPGELTSVLSPRLEEKAEALRPLSDELAKQIGARPLDVMDLLNETASACIAVSPNRNGTSSWIAAMLVLDPAWALKHISGDITPEMGWTLIEETKVSIATLADGRKFYFARVAQWIMITPDADLMEFALEADKGLRKTLDSLHPAQKTKGEKLLLKGWTNCSELKRIDPDSKFLEHFLGGLDNELTSTYFKLAFEKEPVFNATSTTKKRAEIAATCEYKISKAIALSSRSNSIPTWIFRILINTIGDPAKKLRLSYSLSDNGEIEMKSEFAKPLTGENTKQTHAAWWKYLIGIILAPPALVVIIILAFALCATGTALYMYASMWVRGELSPAQPPVLPELSDNLREDLGHRPRDFVKTEGNRTDETGDNNNKNTDANGQEEDNR